MDDLYQAEILELYYHPHNFGEIQNPTCSINEANQSCGDLYTFYLSTKKDKAGVTIIDKITFTGVGCAISMASCSLLTDYLLKKPISIIKELDIEFMQELIGSEVSMGRLKCLMLPARAISKICPTT